MRVRLTVSRCHGVTVSRRHALLVTFALALTQTSCEWFSDFRQQPKIEPWEATAMVGDSTRVSARGNPPFSVPTHGTTVAGFQVSYQPLPATVDSMSSLQNPIAPTDSSLATGQRYYQINCTVCHGDTGMGNGAATRYGMPGISIVTDMTKGRTDGYLWGMIRNGRGLMPSYNRIEDRERWDVVNYIRALQGRLATTARTGAVGYPGETGATLPGHTVIAPTRPPPFSMARPQPGPERVTVPTVITRDTTDHSAHGADTAAALPGGTP